MHVNDPTVDATPTPADVRRVALMVFFQMLPATLLTPAIRPLFAAQHAGNEHAMHAFMALNMVGAALAVPWIGRLAERLPSARSLKVGLLMIDALTLPLLASPLPTHTVLALRTLEGAAHVGVTSLLLADAAALGRRAGNGRAMGFAGAALMFAVALGSALGGQLVTYTPKLPFLVGALLQLGVAVALMLHQQEGVSVTPQHGPPKLGGQGADRGIYRALLVPLSAVFVGRFTVGCLVVTFSLFVHRAHGGSDRSVGLLLSLITLPFALSMYPISRLADRVSRATLMAGGGIVYAVSLAALPLVGFTWLPWVMVTAGVSSACLFAPSLCYAAVLGGERKQRAMALINTAGCVGMLLGPMCAGILSAVLGKADAVAGYRWVFAMAAVSVVMWLTLCLPWLVRQARSEAAHVGPLSPAPSRNA